MVLDIEVQQILRPFYQDVERAVAKLRQEEYGKQKNTEHCT